MVLDIPPGFGRDLAAGRKPDLGVFIDGASPFLAANIQGYADAIILSYSLDRLGTSPPQSRCPPRSSRASSTIRIFAASMRSRRAC
jgi:ribosome-dependent ATPase